MIEEAFEQASWLHCCHYTPTERRHIQTAWFFRFANGNQNCSSVGSLLHGPRCWQSRVQVNPRWRTSCRSWRWSSRNFDRSFQLFHSKHCLLRSEWKTICRSMQPAMVQPLPSIGPVSGRSWNRISFGNSVNLHSLLQSYETQNADESWLWIFTVQTNLQLHHSLWAGAWSMNRNGSQNRRLNVTRSRLMDTQHRSVYQTASQSRRTVTVIETRKAALIIIILISDFWWSRWTRKTVENWMECGWWVMVLLIQTESGGWDPFSEMSRKGSIETINSAMLNWFNRSQPSQGFKIKVLDNLPGFKQVLVTQNLQTKRSPSKTCLPQKLVTQTLVTLKLIKSCNLQFTRKHFVNNSPIIIHPWGSCCSYAPMDMMFTYFMSTLYDYNCIDSNSQKTRVCWKGTQCSFALVYSLKPKLVSLTLDTQTASAQKIPRWEMYGYSLVRLPKRVHDGTADCRFSGKVYPTFMLERPARGPCSGKQSQ